uniref:Uncharacterized protein n=1 Tax=Ciona savignyi TaxID=51511 RepID=H2ZN16_CIOSA
MVQTVAKKMSYFWTKLAEARHPVEENVEESSTCCLFTRVYIRDKHRYENEMEDEDCFSSNDSDENVCKDSNVMFSKPWTDFEGEYASDEQLMLQMGLPVAWKQCKLDGSVNRKQLKTVENLNFSEEVQNNDLSDLELGWQQYWKEMGPEILWQSWEEKLTIKPDIQNKENNPSELTSLEDYISKLDIQDEK